MTHEGQIAEIKHDINGIKQQIKNSQILHKEELKNFEEVVDEMGKKVDGLEKKIDSLLLLLEGHPQDKERGMIPRMIAIEKFIEGMKDTKAYLMGNVAAAVFIITALGGVIAFCIKAYQWIKGL